MKVWSPAGSIVDSEVRVMIATYPKWFSVSCLDESIKTSMIRDPPYLMSILPFSRSTIACGNSFVSLQWTYFYLLTQQSEIAKQSHATCRLLRIILQVAAYNSSLTGDKCIRTVGIDANATKISHTMLEYNSERFDQTRLFSPSRSKYQLQFTPCQQALCENSPKPILLLSYSNRLFPCMLWLQRWTQ